MKNVTPVLKWAGGKRQLIKEIESRIPVYETYYEPFLGGGAVLFHLRPEKAVVNDRNPELVNVYRVIRDHLEELLDSLKSHCNDPEYFYRIRQWDKNSEEYSNISDIQKASRILYLNKTCYNGLYRVNRKGQFNVPFGKYKNPKIVNEQALRALNEYLLKAQVHLRCTDFEKALEGIQGNDFVYFDPPYDPVSSSANFTSYSTGGFGKEEQLRLKQLCDTLNEKGVPFLLSNSATDFIKELYKDYTIEIIKAKRLVNSRADLRGNVDEILVRNY